MAMLGHAVIGRNPCPCIPGEAKAQAVWCCSHTFLLVWRWAMLSRGRLDKSTWQGHPVKRVFVEVMKCCTEISGYLLLGIS